MEFLCCCSAAGIGALPCFTPPQVRADTAAGAVASMAGRGLLLAENDAFVLCPALVDAFRAIRDSSGVILVCRQRFDLPYCLLYGTRSVLVSLRPGVRESEYLGITTYHPDEIAEWREDVGLVLDGNLPEDLLETVSESERSADLGKSPMLEDFLLLHARPGEPLQGKIPDEVTGCIEYRRRADWKPRGRLFFVRMPLYDHLIIGTAEEVHAEIYRASRVEESILGWLNGGMESNDIG